MNATSEIVNYIMGLKKGVINITQIKKKFHCEVEDVSKAINYMQILDKSDIAISHIHNEYYEICIKRKTIKPRWEKVEKFILSIDSTFRATDICRELLKKKFEKEMIFAVIEKLKDEGKIIYNPETVSYRVKK